MPLPRAMTSDLNEASMFIFKRAGDVACVCSRGAGAEPEPPSIPTIAGLVPVTAIMTRDLVCVRREAPVEDVIDLIVDNYIGCLPVVDDDGCPIGMITKRDLVESYASRATPAVAPHPLKAAEIMLPIVLSLDEHATVLQATAMMTRHDIHHVVVVSPKGRLIGLVSSLDIVRWLACNDGVAGGGPPPCSST